ncbi:MAG: hypothetical protein JKY34_08700 [Kordiimonadaceae bacterium]|nr:hypothetical protein [Kordiimonadaceae bacterium]
MHGLSLVAIGVFFLLLLIASFAGQVKWPSVKLVWQSPPPKEAVAPVKSGLLQPRFALAIAAVVVLAFIIIPLLHLVIAAGVVSLGIVMLLRGRLL